MGALAVETTLFFHVAAGVMNNWFGVSLKKKKMKTMEEGDESNCFQLSVDRPRRSSFLIGEIALEWRGHHVLKCIHWLL